MRTRLASDPASAPRTSDRSQKVTPADRTSRNRPVWDVRRRKSGMPWKPVEGVRRTISKLRSIGGFVCDARVNQGPCGSADGRRMPRAIFQDIRLVIAADQRSPVAMRLLYAASSSWPHRYRNAIFTPHSSAMSSRRRAQHKRRVPRELPDATDACAPVHTRRVSNRCGTGVLPKPENRHYGRFDRAISRFAIAQVGVAIKRFGESSRDSQAPNRKGYAPVTKQRPELQRIRRPDCPKQAVAFVAAHGGMPKTFSRRTRLSGFSRHCAEARPEHRPEIPAEIWRPHAH